MRSSTEPPVGWTALPPVLAVLAVLLLAGLACNFPGGGVRAEPTPTAFTAPEFIFTRPTKVPTPTPPPDVPTPTPALINGPEIDNEQPPILYSTQAGDTLPVVAVRFGVLPAEITSPDEIPAEALINPDQLLVIPNRLSATTPGQRLVPDSEIVYSPSAIDFDVNAYAGEAGGYLSRYSEFLGKSGTVSGPEIVRRVALDNSINPMLLLALIDYHSGWVSGQPANTSAELYPLGLRDARREGLYKQLTWTVNQLSIGYYAWREGRLTELTFPDGTTLRLAPELNAGTVALQYLFAQMYPLEQWAGALDMENGLMNTYTEMFGSPWLRAQMVEPLYPPDLAQPELVLPFLRNQLWAYTGGPHGAWEHDGAWAALDFAPGSSKPGCEVSYSWVTAAGAGLVVRSERGVVMVDMDGDGFEQTGWAILYLHVAEEGRVPVGTLVEQGDRLGYPSCEGGISTGTHVHIARKYNGEWIPADGPMPFVLGGWMAHSAGESYKGTLTRGDLVVNANDLGSYDTRIIRASDDP